MKKIALYILVLLLLSSCQKQDIATVEPETKQLEMKEDSDQESSNKIPRDTGSALDKIRLSSASMRFDDAEIKKYYARPYDFQCDKLLWKDNIVDFKCSPDGGIKPYDILEDRYLLYEVYLGTSLLDLLTGEVIAIHSFSFEDYGFTPNNEYLYFCDSQGMLSGGFDTFQLSSTESPKRLDWIPNFSESINCVKCGGYNEQEAAYQCLNLSATSGSIDVGYVNVKNGNIKKDILEKAPNYPNKAIEPSKPNIKTVDADKEMLDRTLIEAYYHFLVSLPEGRNQLLETAYSLKGDNDVSFETFQEWYQNVYSANLTDFRSLGNKKYSFSVELNEQKNRETKTTIYDVQMEVKNQKLYTISSEERME